VDRYQKTGFKQIQWSYPWLPRTENRPQLTGKSLSTLSALPLLESLDLRDAQLNPSDLAALAAFPRLGELGLPHTIDAEAIRHLQSCKRLGALILGNREITASEMEQLAALPSLKRLTLRNARVSHETIAALAKLEHLSIAYCVPVTDAGIRAGVLQKMTHLQFLELRGLTQVTDASLEALSQFGHLKQIGIREDKIRWESVDKMRAAMPGTRVFK
jgi:hypothetical protein